jgi:hypothetical protein
MHLTSTFAPSSEAMSRDALSEPPLLADWLKKTSDKERGSQKMKGATKRPLMEKETPQK